jgi:site-specific recombinase XerD
MGKSFESAVTSYLKARSLSPATGVEYRSTLSKWSEWGKEVPLESIGRADVREFLDWVHERAIDNEGTNPGRTANKCREHLRAVLSWAWEEACSCLENQEMPTIPVELPDHLQS